MKTTEIKATFTKNGNVSIKFDTELTTHHSREILDAVAAATSDSWSEGNITTVEKEKLSLNRKAKSDLDQTEIPLTEEQPKVITDVPYTVTDSLEHHSVPELEHMPEAEAEEPEPEPSEDEQAF